MEQFVQSLASGAGVAGVILGYYLWRLEPRLKSMEDTLARQGKIDLLRLIASPHVAPELKAEAQKMVAEITAYQEKTARVVPA
jgi:hypothetical protein